MVGFPSSVGRATIFGQDSAIGPAEGHFHCELGIPLIFVRLLSLAEPQDQNVRSLRPLSDQGFGGAAL
jgi:hypothetical protein